MCRLKLYSLTDNSSPSSSSTESSCPAAAFRHISERSVHARLVTSVSKQSIADSIRTYALVTLGIASAERREVQDVRGALFPTQKSDPSGPLDSRLFNIWRSEHGSVVVEHDAGIGENDINKITVQNTQETRSTAGCAGQSATPVTNDVAGRQAQTSGAAGSKSRGETYPAQSGSQHSFGIFQASIERFTVPSPGTIRKYDRTASVASTTTDTDSELSVCLACKNANRYQELLDFVKTHLKWTDSQLLHHCAPAPTEFQCRRCPGLIRSQSNIAASIESLTGRIYPPEPTPTPSGDSTNSLRSDSTRTSTHSSLEKVIEPEVLPRREHTQEESCIEVCLETRSSVASILQSIINQVIESQ